VDPFAPFRSVPLEALLAEREWTMRVARRLVADPAAADDLVQQAWLRFLRRPPARAEALRSWLRTVMRNEARQAHRSATRRETRESSLTAPAPEPAPDDVVARVESQRRVAQAVLDLEEPYRSTVLLAFWDGLAPSEIAARTGVPVETVRTRTKRALATLRARLDTESGADGTSWAVALLPVAAWTRADAIAAAAQAAAGTGAVATLVEGGLVMAMPKKAAALVALLALLAGIVGTLGVQSLGVPSGTESVVDLPPPTKDTMQTATNPGRTDSAPRSSRAPDTAMAGALARVVPEPAPAQSEPGRIVGRIALSDGTPVEGVAVRSTVKRPSDDWTWRMGEIAPDPAAAAERIHAATERARIEEESAHWTATDRDGRYVLSGIGDATVWVRTWKEGYSFRRLDRNGMTDAKAGETMDFLATRLAALVADVIAPDGTPMTEAKISLVAVDRSSTSECVWSRSRPHVWTTPGRMTVRAVGGPDDAWTTETMPVDLVAGQFSPRVELRMRLRRGIRGRVVAPPGISVRGATLFMLPVDAGDKVDDAGLLRSRPLAWIGTDSGMGFEILDVAPHRYRLGLAISSAGIVEATTVDVADAIVPLEFAIRAPTSERFVWVRAEAPDGSAISDFRVDISLRTGNSSQGFGWDGFRDKDGTQWIPRRTRYGALEEADECRFSVTAKDYGTTSAVLGPRSPDGVTIRFAAPGWIEVEVPREAPADLVAALSLTLARRPAEGSWGGFESHAQGDRLWRTGPLEPGSYTVIATVTNANGSTHRLATLDVALAATTHRVTLTLPPLRTVVVRVRGATSGTSVRLDPEVRSEPLRTLHADVGRDGAATFRWVPDGAWRVIVAGRKVASREELPRIDVAGDVDVTLD
jgi:RNA polymerase sigma factor (sigma-70 family)